MTEHTIDYARWRGFACTDPPDARVAAALRVHTRKPIGLQWYRQEERDGLSQAVHALSVEDRRKVRLVSAVRPGAR